MKVKNALLILALLLSANLIFADWVTDHANNFKINVPYGWNTNSYMEEDQQVHDFTSSDENIFMQIRCFDNGGYDAVGLAALFEEGLIAEGATALGQSNEELNGNAGVMGVYTMNYGGTDMGVITFSMVNQDLAYLIFVVIPVDAFDQRSDEADAVLNTFTLLSESSSYTQPTQNTKKSDGGFGGLRGSINGTFNFSESGSYPIENQQTVTIRSLDNSGTNALEIYIYNKKGTGSFIYGTGLSGPPKFNIGAVDSKGLGDNSSGTGELTVTEYKEGGRIKGHFTAQADGHDIKGSFNLFLSTPKDYGGYDIK